MLLGWFSAKSIFFCSAQDEKQRIEDLGGCVTFMGCWRVNGTYAVSRAIGKSVPSAIVFFFPFGKAYLLYYALQVSSFFLTDNGFSQLNDFNCPANNPFEIAFSGDFDQKPYVSGDADCSITHLCGDEDYILLACDGFFDSVKPSEVPDLVLNALRQPNVPDSMGDALSEELGDNVGLSVAQHLVGHAKEAGSTDNITVVLVFLHPPQQLLAPLNSTGTAPEVQSYRSQTGPQQ